jgi:hypothetical protein
MPVRYAIQCFDKWQHPIGLVLVGVKWFTHVKPSCVFGQTIYQGLSDALQGNITGHSEGFETDAVDVQHKCNTQPVAYWYCEQFVLRKVSVNCTPG